MRSERSGERGNSNVTFLVRLILTMVVISMVDNIDSCKCGSELSKADLALSKFFKITPPRMRVLRLIRFAYFFK